MVVTDDFIQYLLERDPRIQLAYVRTVLVPYPARGGPALTHSPLPQPQSNSWRWREGTRWCTCSPDLEPNTHQCRSDALMVAHNLVPPLFCKDERDAQRGTINPPQILPRRQATEEGDQVVVSMP